MSWFTLLLPLAALGLDLIFKDFRNFPHPVQAVAWLARRLEPRARQFEARGLVCLPGIAELQAGFLAGGACLALILGASGAAVWGLEQLPLVGILASIYFAYAGLALGGLLRSGQDALAALEQGDIAAARQAVAMLVSRDVSQSDRPTLFRTLAETLSENFNDAVVSPFFWLLLGGPVGLWVYKAASTMDSLWGYRTARWRYLGFASARLDDLLAYLPARLAVFWLWLFSGLVAHAGKWPGYCRVRADAAQMESPNAGYGMAAAAWLHHGQMGGRAVYFGQVKDKPLLGPGGAAGKGTDRTAAAEAGGAAGAGGTGISGEGGIAAELDRAEAHEAGAGAVGAAGAGAAAISGRGAAVARNGELDWNGEKIRALLRHILVAGIGGCILMWTVWSALAALCAQVFAW